MEYAWAYMADPETEVSRGRVAQALPASQLLAVLSSYPAITGSFDLLSL